MWWGVHRQGDSCCSNTFIRFAIISYVLHDCVMDCFVMPIYRSMSPHLQEVAEVSGLGLSAREKNKAKRKAKLFARRNSRDTD